MQGRLSIYSFIAERREPPGRVCLRVGCRIGQFELGRWLGRSARALPLMKGTSCSKANRCNRLHRWVLRACMALRSRESSSRLPRIEQIRSLRDRSCEMVEASAARVRWHQSSDSGKRTSQPAVQDAACTSEPSTAAVASRQVFRTGQSLWYFEESGLPVSCLPMRQAAAAESHPSRVPS